MTIAAALLMAACGPSTPNRGAKHVSKGAHVPETAGEAGPPAGEDVTAQMRAMNSSEHAGPPTDFRAGHVSPRKAPETKKTKYGFEVRFGSGAPVVTPAVYKGKVYTSGGFNSKEFHAFEAATGKSAWSISLDDDGPSSAACEDGTCAFNTESCTLFIVDADTGEQQWSLWLGDPLTGSPTIANGRVFTSYPAAGRVAADAGGKAAPPGATHAMAAFDLKTGKILWQKWLDSGVMSAPVARGTFVYVSTFGGTLVKFDQATGDIRYAIKARATSAPVIEFASDGLESMYFTRRGEPNAEDDGAEEMIMRTDHNKPKTKYKAARKKARYLDKTVQRESSYQAEAEASDSANGFGGAAPSAANPEAAYDNVGQGRVSSMQGFQGSRILHMGDRNVNTMGDELIATSAETGERLWSFKLSGDIAHSGGALGTAPLAAGDSVVFATLAGEIKRIDPANGKVRKTWKIDGRVRAQPVVHDGWIYVGTEDGRLVAIDTRDKKLTGWSMWGGNAQRSGVGPKVRKR
jgi:Ca-activated chloride channel family protein